MVEAARRVRMTRFRHPFDDLFDAILRSWWIPGPTPQGLIVEDGLPTGVLMAKPLGRMIGDHFTLHSAGRRSAT